MYNMSATRPTVHGTVSDELPPPQSPQSPFVHVRVRGCTPVPHDELHAPVMVHVVQDRGVPDLVSNSNTCHALTDGARGLVQGEAWTKDATVADTRSGA